MGALESAYVGVCLDPWWEGANAERGCLGRLCIHYQAHTHLPEKSSVVFCVAPSASLDFVAENVLSATKHHLGAYGELGH